MNFLKKKLKPLTSGLTSSHSASHNRSKRNEQDLEDDLYDEYVVEAPPHPSELIALGIDPSEIDVNDPEKLRELYRKAVEEGKDKKTNSVLLARQRQKEDIERKKKSTEEWKYFDSLTARVEQAVKHSQATLEQLRESSAIEQLTKPDYELRLSADEVFRSSAGVKQEKGANEWMDFDEDANNRRKQQEAQKEADREEQADGSAASERKTSAERAAQLEAQKFIAEELLEDFGFDLRPKEERAQAQAQAKRAPVEEAKLEPDCRAAARPRPRPNAGREGAAEQPAYVDPFDTSFVSTPAEALADSEHSQLPAQAHIEPPRAIDPFDTSYVQL